MFDPFGSRDGGSGNGSAPPGGNRKQGRRRSPGNRSPSANASWAPARGGNSPVYGGGRDVSMRAGGDSGGMFSFSNNDLSLYSLPQSGRKSKLLASGYATRKAAKLTPTASDEVKRSSRGPSANNSGPPSPPGDAEEKQNLLSVAGTSSSPGGRRERGARAPAVAGGWGGGRGRGRDGGRRLDRQGTCPCAGVACCAVWIVRSVVAQRVDVALAS